MKRDYLHGLQNRKLLTVIAGVGSMLVFLAACASGVGLTPAPRNAEVTPIQQSAAMLTPAPSPRPTPTVPPTPASTLAPITTPIPTPLPTLEPKPALATTLAPSPPTKPIPTPVATHTSTPFPTLIWRTVNPPLGVRVANSKWIEVDAPEGKKILAAVSRPPGPGPFPVVVVLHGTMGFRLLHTQLAEDLTKGGFITVAGCWFGGHYRTDPVTLEPLPTTWPDGIPCPNGPPTTFARPGINVPASVANVTPLIEAARTLPGARATRVGVFGHSRGSMAALAVAFTGADLQAVVAVAGYLPRGAANLKAPVLILHGTADNVIPVQQARALEGALRALGKPVEAMYYAGAPHTIPYDAPWRDDVRQHSVSFFSKYLLD